MKSIEDAILSIMTNHPTAHYQGFLGETKHPLLTDCLNKDGFRVEVERAISWFKHNPKVRITKKPSNYAELGTVKHCVEKWVNNTEHLGYISRGAVLVAAESLGIPYKKDKLFISKDTVSWPIFTERYTFVSA